MAIDSGGFSGSAEHEISFLFGPKRPKGRRLTLAKGAKAEGKASAWRTVSKAPEVMVRVSGGGKNVQHVKAHFDYISRNGKLEMVNDQGEQIRGKEGVQELFDSWDMDLGRGQGKNKQAFNVILSMPAGTDPQKVLGAAQGFAREQLYGKHQYAMVLHTQDTDPHKDAPAHPHVHLIIKAEGYDGKRLYIRKATLEVWRRSFAEQLRERGIEANATTRDVRGITRKAQSPAQYHLAKRGQSHVLEAKLNEARKELNEGATASKPWEKAIQNRRAKTIREMLGAAEQYDREGDRELAAAIRKHAAELPKLETERHQLKKAIVEQVQKQRAQEQERSTQNPKAKGEGREVDRG